VKKKGGRKIRSKKKKETGEPGEKTEKTTVLGNLKKRGKKGLPRAKRLKKRIRQEENPLAGWDCGEGGGGGGRSSGFGDSRARCTKGDLRRNVTNKSIKK